MSAHLYLKPNARDLEDGHQDLGNGPAIRVAERSFGDVNPAKELNKMATTYGTPEKSSLKEGVISSVENTKKNTGNVIRSRLMSELKLLCHKLDKSTGEMRSELSHYLEESDSELKSLVRHTQEAHRCVRIIIDKQELDDTQKGLAKLHLAQKDPFSSGGQNEERTSAPSSGPKKGTETPSDRHDHHHQQQVAPLQPSFVPQQQIIANQTPQYLPAKQTPQVNQQGPQQPVQSVSVYQQWPAQPQPFIGKALVFRKVISKSIRALARVKAKDETKLFINVDLNKTKKTMSIIDNGIGMTKADLEKDGGLCSFFLVAKKIVVVTKHEKDEQYVCEASRGDNCFKIVRDDTSTSLGRGTKITLILDDDHLVYLKERCMQGLIDRHFKYIDYKITIRNYDSANNYQSELVHYSCCKPLLSLWYKVIPLSTTLEVHAQKIFDERKKESEKIFMSESNEDDAQKKRNEKKMKEFESRKLMAKAHRKKVEKVVMSESSVSSKTACTKTEALTVEINPWEPNIIIKKLAELAAEDSDKYYKVLKKMIVCVGIIIGIISGCCCTFPRVRRFVP